MRITIKAIPPFDFGLRRRDLNGDKQIRKYENDKYWQVVRLETNYCQLQQNR